MLSDRIEIDGAVELLRCPDFSRGWLAEEISLAYTPETWRLPAEFDALRDRWERRHPGERSDAKVALREVRVDRRHALVCALQATSWRDVRPLHEDGPLDEALILRRERDGCELLVPNIGVMHVIASTADGWILVIRRSEWVHYHPGSWSATYEEGIAPADLEGGAALQQAARRGLAEELAPDATISLDAFRVVSVVLERPIGNPAMVVVANLPISRDEVVGRKPSGELDAHSLLWVPIELKALRDVMTASPMSLERPGAWHPTARYRLFAAIAHFFGEQEARECVATLRVR